MPDFDRARRNIAVFADELARMPMTLWQARALTLRTRTTAIVAPRQSGKSRSLAVAAAYWAFRKPRQHVLIVSAGEDAARRLLSEVRRLVTGSPYLEGSVTDEGAALVALSNGSVIRSVPASERQIRGWTVDLLLVDEAALVSDDLLLGAAIPTTAARPDARVVLASSATVASGAFFDHVRRAEAGSQNIALHRWALTDCKWISPSVIEAARESMTETRFAAEYEGVFASGADSLFTRASLDAATRDYLPDRLAEMRGPARVLAGVDWGVSHDHSAVAAIGRLAGTRTFAVRCTYRWPSGHPLHDVYGSIAASPAHFDTIAMETNGVGAPCAQELTRLLRQRPAPEGGGPARRLRLVDVQDWEFGKLRKQIERDQLRREIQPGPSPFVTRKVSIHTTAELKATGYTALRLAIDRGRLLLPASAEDLRRELLLLRVDLQASGTERIEASVGHDDLADALMLATVPHRDKRGRWQTVLGQLIAGEDEPVSAERLPVWQSVSGPETTSPGQTGPPPESPRLKHLRERVGTAIDPRED
ncbi:hypothetical protein HJD18_10455 [Thermoleophilia bacterium SCSIO 60948]|nr:hypothetical protein HJD18_10455 [Thermoleophilia bacterium SCSIO 60948]